MLWNLVTFNVLRYIFSNPNSFFLILNHQPPLLWIFSSNYLNYTVFLYLFPNIISHQLFSKNFHKAIFVKVIIYVYFLIKITLWSWILCSKYGKIWNSSISIQLKRGCKYVDVTYYIYNYPWVNHNYNSKWNLYQKNTIFGLKMMVKSGLEKFILKFLHAGRWLFLLLNLWFWTLLWSKEK